MFFLGVKYKHEGLYAYKNKSSLLGDIFSILQDNWNGNLSESKSRVFLQGCDQYGMQVALAGNVTFKSFNKFSKRLAQTNNFPNYFVFIKPKINSKPYKGFFKATELILSWAPFGPLCRAPCRKSIIAFISLLFTLDWTEIDCSSVIFCTSSSGEYEAISLVLVLVVNECRFN